MAQGSLTDEEQIRVTSKRTRSASRDEVRATRPERRLTPRSRAPWSLGCSGGSDRPERLRKGGGMEQLDDFRGSNRMMRSVVVLTFLCLALVGCGGGGAPAEGSPQTFTIREGRPSPIKRASLALATRSSVKRAQVTSAPKSRSREQAWAAVDRGQAGSDHQCWDAGGRVGRCELWRIKGLGTLAEGRRRVRETAREAPENTRRVSTPSSGFRLTRLSCRLAGQQWHRQRHIHTC
jgi:hypothetical protein